MRCKSQKIADLISLYKNVLGLVDNIDTFGTHQDFDPDVLFSQVSHPRLTLSEASFF